MLLFVAFEALVILDAYNRTDEEYPIGTYIVTLFYALAIMFVGTALLIVDSLGSGGH